MRAWEAVKFATLTATHALGMNRGLRHLHRRHLLTVAYHGVLSSRRDPLGYSVHVSEFERQIGELARLFRPISLSDLIAALDSRARLPERAVLVTFDDGYRNHITNAAPVLRRLGVPAVFHVPTGYIGTRRILWVEEIRLRVAHWPRSKVPMPGGRPDYPLPFDPAGRLALAERVAMSCKDLSESAKRSYLDRLREVRVPFDQDCLQEAYAFMTWDELRQVHRWGFDVGSHTVHHPILSGLTPEEAAWGLAESKRVLEDQLGAPCNSIAYPNGRREDVTDLNVKAAKEAGYRVGFFVMDRFNRSLVNPLALTRVNMPGYRPACVFQSRISGLVEARAAFARVLSSMKRAHSSRPTHDPAPRSAVCTAAPAGYEPERGPIAR